MIALFIDTTSEYSSVQVWRSLVLADARTILAEERWLSEKKLGNDLLPKIVAQLNQVKISLKDLDCILVNAGPGSFTGTRVGVSTANALAWALDIPVFASDSADKLSTPELLSTLHFFKPVVPKYATPPKVTMRKK